LQREAVALPIGREERLRLPRPSPQEGVPPVRGGKRVCCPEGECRPWCRSRIDRLSASKTCVRNGSAGVLETREAAEVVAPPQRASRRWSPGRSRARWSSPAVLVRCRGYADGLARGFRAGEGPLSAVRVPASAHAGGRRPPRCEAADASLVGRLLGLELGTRQVSCLMSSPAVNGVTPNLRRSSGAVGTGPVTKRYRRRQETRPREGPARWGERAPGEVPQGRDRDPTRSRARVSRFAETGPLPPGGCR
jgi:hypothetical protein